MSLWALAPDLHAVGVQWVRACRSAICFHPWGVPARCPAAIPWALAGSLPALQHDGLPHSAHSLCRDHPLCHRSLQWPTRAIHSKDPRKCIWVRSQRCDSLVTWFCYQLIAKPGNKTATSSVTWSISFDMKCPVQQPYFGSIPYSWKKLKYPWTHVIGYHCILYQVLALITGVVMMCLASAVEWTDLAWLYFYIIWGFYQL